MGANQQKEAAAAVQYFAHVVSPTTRTTPTVDSFATQLSQHAAVLCGGCSLYTAAQPLVHTLLAHTEQTGRLRWLLYTCCTLFDGAVQGHAAATPSQLAALRVMELVLRHTHAAVHGRCDTLLRLLCATGTRDNNNDDKNDDDNDDNSNSNSKANEDVASWLCQLLMVYTVDVELSKTTAATHAAVMCLLLTLTSSALHHSCALREAYVDVFTEMMMSCSVLKRFVLVLLHRTARWGTAPAVSSPLLYANSNAPLLHKMMSWLRTPPGGARRGGSGGGAAGGSASSVGKDKTHWLTLAAELQRIDKASNSSSNSNSKNNNAEDDGYTTHEHSGSNNNSGSGVVVLDCCGCAELVSRHSAQLLAVLVAHQKGNGCNPALMYVMAMRDQQPIPFATLLRSLAVKLPSCPALCMVLYVLLHDHATFLRDTLALDAGAVVAVVHSLLQLLHAASSIPTRTTTATTQAHSDATRATRATSVTAAVPLPRLHALMCEAVRFAAPFVAFMAATLLLIASQQRRVAALLADAVCSSTPLLPSSYAGRHVSMAALTVVVLGVAVTRALRDGHEALADVLTPCLVNVASAVHDLDAVSAHRFIALVAELIARVRYMAHEHAQLTAAAAAAAATSMSDSDKETAAVATTRLQASCQMYLRQLAVVVEALEAMFADGSRRNDTLTYALLYTRDAFIATSCDGDDGSSGSSSSSDGDDSEKVSGGGEACSTHDILVALRQTCRRCVARIHDYACVLAHPAARGTQTADDIMRRIRCKSSADTTACIASPHSNKDSHSNDNKATTGASDDTAQRGSDSDDDGEDTTRAATTVVAHDGCDADESTAQHDSQSNGRKEGNNDSNNDDDASAFVYEELPNSYSFFGCFVWAVLLSDARYPGGVLWTTELHTLPLFPRSD